MARFSCCYDSTGHDCQHDSGCHHHCYSFGIWLVFKAVVCLWVENRAHQNEGDAKGDHDDENLPSNNL